MGAHKAAAAVRKLRAAGLIDVKRGRGNQSYIRILPRPA